MKIKEQLEETLCTYLSAHSVRRRPQSIIFFCDFTVVDYSLQLLHHTLVHVSLDTTFRQRNKYKPADNIPATKSNPESYPAVPLLAALPSGPFCWHKRPQPRRAALFS